MGDADAGVVESTAWSTERRVWTAVALEERRGPVVGGRRGKGEKEEGEEKERKKKGGDSAGGG